MFKVGEYIIHGTCGVYRVEKIGLMNDEGMAEENLFWGWLYHLK